MRMITSETSTLDGVKYLETTLVKTPRISSGSDDGLGSNWMLWRRRRFATTALAFMGVVSMYATRTCFSVAIVAMTTGPGTHARLFPFANASGNVHENFSSGRSEFSWDSRTQGLLLSGFFYGYLASQLPAGWLVARAGAAALLGAGVAGSALLALLAPSAAHLGGAPLLLATRVVQGLLQGAVFPAVNQLLARWAPPLERARLIGAIASGCNVGLVAAMPLSGLLAAHVGWPAIFYVFGGVGCLWWILWSTQVEDSPEIDRRASLEERQFISHKLGTTTVTAKVVSHPWRRILTSKPYLAKVAANFSADWGFYMFITQIPMYLKDTLGLDVREAGLVSALPFAAMAVLQHAAGHLNDSLERRRRIAPTVVRKSFVCVSFCACALSLITSTVLQDFYAVVACVVVGVAAAAFAYIAISINTLDLAPLHASVLAGACSTVSNLSGIVNPLLTGCVVRTQSVWEWRVVFYVACAIYATGAAVFALFGSAERQPWAEDGLVEPPASSSRPPTYSSFHEATTPTPPEEV